VCFAGDYFQPTYNLIDGFQPRRVDPSALVSAVGGQRSGERRQKLFALDGRYEDMPESDMKTFQQVFDALGITDPFFFAVDPDDQDEIYYCNLADELKTPHSRQDTWHVDVSVIEAL
jgi:hypothetical protein